MLCSKQFVSSSNTVRDVIWKFARLDFVERERVSRFLEWNFLELPRKFLFLAIFYAALVCLKKQLPRFLNFKSHLFLSDYFKKMFAHFRIDFLAIEKPFISIESEPTTRQTRQKTFFIPLKLWKSIQKHFFDYIQMNEHWKYYAKNKYFFTWDFWLKGKQKNNRDTILFHILFYFFIKISFLQTRF